MRQIKLGDAVMLNDFKNVIFYVLSRENENLNIGKYGCPWENQMKVHESLLKIAEPPSANNFYLNN